MADKIEIISPEGTPAVRPPRPGAPPRKVGPGVDEGTPRPSIDDGPDSDRARTGPKLDAEAVRKQVNELEQRVSRFTNRLGFELDTKEFVLQIMDRETGSVVHRFPPEDLATLGERLEETANLVVDRYA